MNYRWLSLSLARDFRKPYVHILFGARQTGKTTLLRSLLPAPDFLLDLADPVERNRLAADPGAFIRACKALERRSAPTTVVVDEAQAVPAIFDAVQTLYDSNKARWRFILSGSSARKLRQSGANLLPGRSLMHRLFPLMLNEHPSDQGPSREESVLPLPGSDRAPQDPFPQGSLTERLSFGELPGVLLAPAPDRPGLLRSYALAHLEEEIRREALLKDWSAFLRFLQFAAAESGQIVNYAKIAKEVGISPVTVKSHYQLLEDMFVGFSIPGFSKSPRKNLTSTPRFYFFDLGVRHAAAGLTPGADIVAANPGPILEQWVGIELWKRLGYLGSGRLHHFRTKDGAEVDFIVERGGEWIPIEVKWTERPRLDDARHLLTLIDENGARIPRAYVVCRCPRREQLHERIFAIPWHEL